MRARARSRACLLLPKTFLQRLHLSFSLTVLRSACPLLAILPALVVAGATTALYTQIDPSASSRDAMTTITCDIADCTNRGLVSSLHSWLARAVPTVDSIRTSEDVRLFRAGHRLKRFQSVDFAIGLGGSPLQ